MTHRFNTALGLFAGFALVAALPALAQAADSAMGSTAMSSSMPAKPTHQPTMNKPAPMKTDAMAGGAMKADAMSSTGATTSSGAMSASGPMGADMHK